MLKIVTVIGARPQFIKAAALSRLIKTKFKGKINEIIVQTGQHYDHNMSQVFIDELGIPEPAYNLGVGSASHGIQTGRMIEQLEKVLLTEKPGFVVVYGDTNSTLAASIAASKIGIPVAHIEAGLRSYNKSMPEEINRIVCDHTSTLLFTPTKTGLKNLGNEGFDLKFTAPYTADKPGVFHCGDVMYDNSLYFIKLAEKNSKILNDLDLINKPYYLVTVHRDNNTDDPERLNSIFSALDKISRDENKMLVFPVHPRTEKALKTNLTGLLKENIKQNSNLKMILPVSFLDMIMLEKHCEMVFTDSGGLQKEAYFFQKPVIVLRPETEWKEIIDVGAGIVVDSDENRIIEAHNLFKSQNRKLHFPSIFGDGHAAEFICEKLLL
jgi:UDP-GlcNAc3NAcA epimerase